MKKLLMGSVALFLFSLSVLLFQISCQKDVHAQTGSYILPVATASSLGGVIVGDGLQITTAGKLSVLASQSSGLVQLNKILYVKELPNDVEIWTANTDGSGSQKANIVLPSGLTIVDTDAKMSPDGKTIFFQVDDGTLSYIYSCNTDGSNVKRVIDGTGANWVSISGVY